MTVMIQQVVFHHGEDLYDRHGVARRVTNLRALSGALPPGMFAYYTVTTELNGSTLVRTVKQARSQHGRRSDVYANECDAQRALLKWATRILHERARKAP